MLNEIEIGIKLKNLVFPGWYVALAAAADD